MMIVFFLRFDAVCFCFFEIFADSGAGAAKSVDSLFAFASASSSSFVD